MVVEKKHCRKLDKYTLPRDKKKISFFAGFMLLLLPKCPFCFMAFSSTFVLCDQAGTFTDTHTHSSSTTFLLSLLFCVITLASIIFNYRGNRTKYALLLALAGSSYILFSIAIGGGLALYYIGVAFIFSGVWLNGSLLFIVGKIRDFLFKNRGNRIVEFPMT
jgi:hypothetical protein